ncbi:DUF1566 domain-containing protein [Paenacidovorax caeni]|nr:DUF1566 domain-containing protein [Paenacidovorax caeni]
MDPAVFFPTIEDREAAQDAARGRYAAAMQHAIQAQAGSQVPDIGNTENVKTTEPLGSDGKANGAEKKKEKYPWIKFTLLMIVLSMGWFGWTRWYLPAEALQRAERRYVISTDGQTVTDKETGLMWMRCSLGQSWDGSRCAGEARKYTWDEARKAAQNYRYAGYGDWRLPDIEELSTLVYCSSGLRWKFKAGSYDVNGKCLGDYHRPTIFSSAFPNTPSSYVWSGSPNADFSNYAWVVYFGNGDADVSGGRGFGYRVRLVRGGQ